MLLYDFCLHYLPYREPNLAFLLVRSRGKYTMSDFVVKVQIQAHSLLLLTVFVEDPIPINILPDANFNDSHSHSSPVVLLRKIATLIYFCLSMRHAVDSYRSLETSMNSLPVMLLGMPAIRNGL